MEKMEEPTINTDSRPPSTGRKKEKWITKQMAEQMDRQEFLRATFNECFVYIIFVVLITLYAYSLRTSSRYYLNMVLKAQFIEQGFLSRNYIFISYKEIQETANFWMYVRFQLMSKLYWEILPEFEEEELPKELPKEDQKILFANTLLGVPRIRQVRMKDSSCKVSSYFKKIIKKCYSKYSMSNEDKSPYGSKDSSAWKYSSSSETKSLSYKGKISTYGGGGYYTDLKVTKNESNELLKNLRHNMWIDRGTRAVFIDFTVYNANTNLFGICKLVFELPATGGIMTSSHFHSVQLIRFIDTMDYVETACELLFYVFIVFYLIEELRELIYFKLKYFTDFWTYIDLPIIAIGFVMGAIQLTMFLSFPSAIKAVQKNPKKYGNFEQLGYLQDLLSNFVAVELFLIYIKIFKYLNFNKRMTQLSGTLKSCALDILAFTVMFFIIFLAYSLVGYLIFGRQIYSYSTVGNTMFTLLRTILGDFDYHEIEAVSKFLAPIYFISYIFLVFFVLLNMFLAIINDAYSNVKGEIAMAPEEMQMTDYVKMRFMNCFKRCCKNKKPMWKGTIEIDQTVEELKTALKNFGFSDIEIEMFFARFNIDTKADVGKYDVDSILKSLENQQATSSSGAQMLSGYVNIEDFQRQQEELQSIRSTIDHLTNQFNTLLEKIDELRETKTKNN